VSVLGIAGFKELIAGMFLIAVALGLREIERSDDGRVAIVVGIAVITAGMIAAYSYPGVIWLAITIGIWIVAELIRARIDDGPGAARALVRRSRPIAIPALIVLVLLGLAMLPRAIDFLDSGAWDTITKTDSKLRYAVSPLESFGIWPSGEWLLSTTDVTSFWIFGAIGIAAIAFGVIWWVARRDLAVPSALLAGSAVYVGTQIVDTGLYVQAKALVIPASLVMLVIVLALLSPGGGWPKRIFAAVFVALAAYSSFLALRDAVVAPDNRFHELAEFRDEVDGQSVLSLTSDRFADYGLRTATVFSPAFNAEYRVEPQVTKSQRLRSTSTRCPPRSSTSSLRGHHQRRVSEPGAAGMGGGQGDRLVQAVAPRRHAADRDPLRGGASRSVYRCQNPKIGPSAAGGELLTWQPRSVIAKRLYWSATARSTARSPPARGEPGDPPRAGRWELSLQYVSPVTSVVVRAPGLEATSSASTRRFYRPDQGPYWPVGEVASDGETITVSVEADEARPSRSCWASTPTR
jgi:hypothetical protein